MTGDRCRCSPKELSATQRPPTIAAISSTKPITDTSVTRPGRMKRRYSPISRAIGMVQPTENTPQALSASAFTQTIASTASTIISITKTTMIATVPPNLPISSRAIWPSDRPPRA